MKFKALAVYLQKLENTSSRIEMTEILAEVFSKVNASEIDKTVNLLLGQLAPAYKAIVFNMADNMMVAAIAVAFDKTEGEVEKKYRTEGDLGNVAAAFSNKKDSSLTIRQVYKKLMEIAKLEGEGSQDEKIKHTAALLKAADCLSVRYLARIPVGKLRLGFSDKTIIDALSWMIVGDKSESKKINKVYEYHPDVGALARGVKNCGLEKGLSNFKLEIGTPVLPMLASRLKSPVEMIEKMGQVSVEPKFDGLRVQIHYQKGKPILAFTRNLNEISHMFPELEGLQKQIRAKSVMLDCEAIGVDPKTKKMVDFQTTMQRRRKHGISESKKQIPLQFQVFDLIFIDGQSLMGKNYLSRRKKLEQVLQSNKTFRVDEKIITNDPEVIRSKHRQFLSLGLEGVMVKKTDAQYVPGRTGWRWVKMKEVEGAQGKLSDTVDAVILGFSRGKGKRVGFGVGQFLAGVKKGSRFVSITKVGTGMTDEQFKSLAERLRKIRSDKKPKQYDIHSDLKPEFWVEPEVVVELAADEITKSPKHTAGFALRFPRLVKFRDDKGPAQATTFREIKKLYDLQG